ncbi:MAG TPA: helix-turn-helix domain-containing protein [Chloroflexota bacterium]|nr:helix-turn-helix domain-containing protein [Chloroflexota bacterium]
MTLDARHVAVLRALAARRGTYPPTLRELARELGLRSTSSVYARLTRLRYMGLVAFEERRARTLRLTDAGRALLAGEAGAAGP